ncbi:MAG TPA: DUF5753 domain-containing protein [Pseudonocardiaceae bacterium]|jgi:hypothetical protein|nr:DUF5753 domain-containing protein [Pseudonocardiaceae bacterium]
MFGVFGDEAEEIVALAAELDDDYRLLTHNDKLPDELRTLIHHERAAEVVDSCEPALIPGLLQMESYAGALFHWAVPLPSDGIDSLIEARMERQKLLDKSCCPAFTLFVHESALHPHMISARVMNDQRMKLMFAADRDLCTIRIVPIQVGPTGTLGGPFMVMRHTDYKPIACVENVSTSAFLEEPTHTDVYQRIVKRLTSLALDEGQSKELITGLAM